MGRKAPATTKGRTVPAKATGRVRDLRPKSGAHVRGGASGDPLKGLNVDKGGTSQNTLGWTWKKGG